MKLSRLLIFLGLVALSTFTVLAAGPHTFNLRALHNGKVMSGGEVYESLRTTIGGRTQTFRPSIVRSGVWNLLVKSYGPDDEYCFEAHTEWVHPAVKSDWECFKPPYPKAVDLHLHGD